MAEKQIILTQSGLEKLEKELEELKSVKRKEIAEKIKVALSFGDLSENSEYDEAKNEQAMMEARIADIEVMLKRVKVIDEDELSNEHIHIGSKVELRVTNKQTGKSEFGPGGHWPVLSLILHRGGGRFVFFWAGAV